MSENKKSKITTKDKAQSIINNTLEVQIAMLNNNDKLWVILDYISNAGTYTTKDVFTASIDPINKLYDNDIKLYFSILKNLNLIQEKTIKIAKTKESEKYIFLTTRAIQIIEDKENISDVPRIPSPSEIRDMNSMKLSSEKSKDMDLAMLLNLVEIEGIEDEDAKKRQLLFNMRNIDVDIESVQSSINLNDTFPVKQTMESKRNTNGRKLINSNIYRFYKNMFYVYIKDDVFGRLNKINPKTKRTNLELHLEDIVKFLNKNFGEDLEIYTNLAIECDAITNVNKMLKNNESAYGKTKITRLNSKIVIPSEKPVIEAPSQAQVEAKRLQELEAKRRYEAQMEAQRKAQEEANRKRAEELEARNREQEILRAKLNIANKYLGIVARDLQAKKFDLETGTKKDIPCVIVVNFESSLYLPCCLTVNKNIPEYSNKYEEFFNINIEITDTEDIIKDKVYRAYKDMLDYMRSNTTEKITLFNKNKYSFTLDRL